MRVSRKKTDDDEVQFIAHRNQKLNRRMKMEQLMMKNIMRLVVVGSVIAIAANALMMFG